MPLERNHRVKLLRGYGMSITLKNNQIILKNGKHFYEKEHEIECYFPSRFPYERIVISGKGILSTDAIKTLSENNVNVILTDSFGNPVSSFNFPMVSGKGSRNRMGQKVNRRIGNLFNPVIFAYITGFARAQLFSFVKEHNLEKDLVSFATDSVCVTRKVDVDSDELGKFGLDKYAEDVYYLQNGFYRFNGSWKLRGLGKLGRKDIEHIDTIEKDGRLYYKYLVNRTKQLASAIIQNKFDEIGRINQETREVNLNGDDKRFWLKRLENINDGKMNNSMSLNPEFFAEKFELNDDYS